jgi:hypothetical protein
VSFVYEAISDSDFEKYKILEIDKCFNSDLFRRWSIDRDRHIYLRSLGSGTENDETETFSLFYENHLFRFVVKSKDRVTDSRGNTIKVTLMAHTWIGGKFASSFDAIIQAFVDAMRADYKSIELIFEFVNNGVAV